ncbi:MAG: phospholipase D family protein, partial [Rhizobium sp.]|nr:phospholipase D family protein [Rhizobium sp.]
MRVAKMILIGLVLFALASWLTVYVYGRFAAQARGAPSEALAVVENGTALDRVVAAQTARHPDMSGLRLVSDNMDAFAVRAHAARAAGRSLDLQYYYWRDDLTGSLLGREILAAADRGVRVRLLLDDINSRGDGDDIYAAYDSHP